MANGGKLTKLKSVLKKFNSFTNRNSSAVAITSTVSTHSSPSDDTNGPQLYPVYVGKSCRRYLVTADVICNPVFRELVYRSGGNDDQDSIMTVGCEVVLFEHLLWMLENAEHEEAYHELAQYYAC